MEGKYPIRTCHMDVEKKRVLNHFTHAVQNLQILSSIWLHDCGSQYFVTNFLLFVVPPFTLFYLFHFRCQSSCISTVPVPSYQ